VASKAECRFLCLCSDLFRISIVDKRNICFPNVVAQVGVVLVLGQGTKLAEIF
jgi:hypothetical protein